MILTKQEIYNIFTKEYIGNGYLYSGNLPLNFQQLNKILIYVKENERNTKIIKKGL